MLILHPSLCKGNPAAVGEQVGGQYAHRVQTGYEKDNSPKYRYFKTEDEYKQFIANQSKKKKKTTGGKDSKKKDLKEKLTAEQKKVKPKETGKKFSERGKLFVKDKKKKLSKSVGLYIGVDDE